MTSKLITTWKKTRVLDTWNEAITIGRQESAANPLGFAKVECSSGKIQYLAAGVDAEMRHGVVTPKRGFNAKN